MKAANHEDLFRRYQSGAVTPEEQALVEGYILSHKFNELHLSEDELLAAKASLGERISRIPFAERTAASLYRKWKGTIAVAAAVAAVTLGVWLYYSSDLFGGRHADPSLSSRATAKDLNDIAPGKNTATLTLASGEVINLDTTKNSVVVTDSVKTVTMLTASTPRGGQYQVVLPDGTKVWLNADSKISFPSQFIGSERKILLEGEAYFEVAKLTRSSLRDGVKQSQRVPFIVESGGQQVEVLGTHFNINSYADEGPIRTTLLEGSVRVTKRDRMTKDAATILKPGQQAYLKGDELQVTVIDPSDAIAWKNDILLFKDEDLGTALRKVGRWYNVDIEYRGEVRTTATFTGRISRNRNLSSVIEMLEATGLAKFKIEGRRLVVMK